MAFFHFVLCILCLNLTLTKCIENQISDIHSNFVAQNVDSVLNLNLDEIRSDPECDCGPYSVKCQIVQGEKYCDCINHKYKNIDGFCQLCYCGPNSEKCNIVEGEKVCECSYKYRQIDGFCEPYCKGQFQCGNDAPCVNESCQCLPGTRGDHCQVVDECEGVKGAIKCGDPKKIYCRYDSETQKAICACSIDERLYDESRRKCFECDCNKKYGTCSLVDGKKTCKCNPGTAVRKEGDEFGGYPYIYKCSPCDCGKNSNGCSFKDLSGYGRFWSQVCDCKEGYYEQDGWDKTCAKCECGPHGTCIPRGSSVGCNCDDGYKPFLTNDGMNISCEECDCGRNGLCSFENEEKKCECDKFYAEKDGKCVACQCYANGKTVGCYFEGRTQHCLCPQGYENGTFFCKDTNECELDVCPRNTYCVNTEGSFECSCEQGYEVKVEGGDPKIYGCDDIDECEIESMCPRVHTLCTNLPGTYTCECEWGYEPVTPYESAAIAGCQKRLNKPVSSPWKTAVIIVGVILGLSIVGLSIAILIKSRSAERLPRTDTTLRRMR